MKEEKMVKESENILPLDTKVVFITGGGIGLGKNLVEEFLKEGYSVAFTYRTEHEFVKQAIE